MHVVRRFSFISVLLGAIIGCKENVLAPGVCPEFCPPSIISVIDTLLLDIVERDSSFGGYIEAYETLSMQVAGPGSPVEGRGVIVFARFSENITVGGGISGEASPPDSFQVDLLWQRRNMSVPGMEVVLHRIPITVDRSTTFADLDPFFDDSTIVGVISVADSATVPDSLNADTISVMIPGDAFPDFENDSLQLAVGLSVRATAPTFISIGTSDATGQAARVTRFASVDSAGTAVEGSDARTANFDTFVRPPVADVGPMTHLVGGLPTSRSLLRMTVPESILDSSEVVGATLFIVPVVPAAGAPADTFRIQANALSADFGPKSPLVILSAAGDD